MPRYPAKWLSPEPGHPTSGKIQMSPATFQSGPFPCFGTQGVRKNNQGDFSRWNPHHPLLQRLSPRSLAPDSGGIGNTRKRTPRTARRGFGDPALAAPPAWLSNGTWMSMLHQLVAELWPFGGLGDMTRGGTGSPKVHSCPTK